MSRPWPGSNFIWRLKYGGMGSMATPIQCWVAAADGGVLGADAAGAAEAGGAEGAGVAATSASSTRDSAGMSRRVLIHDLRFVEGGDGEDQGAVAAVGDDHQVMRRGILIAVAVDEGIAGGDLAAADDGDGDLERLVVGGAEDGWGQGRVDNLVSGDGGGGGRLPAVVIARQAREAGDDQDGRDGAQGEPRRAARGKGIGGGDVSGVGGGADDELADGGAFGLPLQEARGEGAQPSGRAAQPSRRMRRSSSGSSLSTRRLSCRSSWSCSGPGAAWRTARGGEGRRDWSWSVLRLLVLEHIAEFLAGAEEAHLDDARGDAHAGGDLVVATVVYMFKQEHFDILHGQTGDGLAELGEAFGVEQAAERVVGGGGLGEVMA